MRITVIRSVPPVVIGSVGIVPNHEFEVFEARLDAVEASGVTVERLQPEEINEVMADRPALVELMKGHLRSFPVVLVKDEIVSSGRYPTSTEWAHVLCAGRRAEETAPTH
jgi:hypothetical protein